MNKRIRELMLEAGYAAPELAVRGQLLAELIVQECVGIADHSNVTGKSIIGQRIKEHFGVEEK